MSYPREQLTYQLSLIIPAFAKEYNMGETKHTEEQGSVFYRTVWWAVYLLAFIAAPVAIWINYKHTADASALLKMALPLGVFCLVLIGRLVFLHATRDMSRMVR